MQDAQHVQWTSKLTRRLGSLMPIHSVSIAVHHCGCCFRRLPQPVMFSLLKRIPEDGRVSSKVKVLFSSKLSLRTVIEIPSTVGVIFMAPNARQSMRDKIRSRIADTRL